jgi:RNA polymerase sigma-70 factor (ECF subfamily)
MVLDHEDLSRYSDEQLLAAIASCRGEAFSVFYRRHLPAVLAYLIRQTGDPEAAADLAAEVFSAVLLSSRRYKSTGPSAAPWVIGIAHKKLLMSLRRGRVESKARRRLGFEPVALDDDDFHRIESTAGAGFGRLASLVSQLPANERFAVNARVVEERSYQDIATELGCSQMVVRKRVSRGLARVREQLGDA